MRPLQGLVVQIGRSLLRNIVCGLSCEKPRAGRMVLRCCTGLRRVCISMYDYSASTVFWPLAVISVSLKPLMRFSATLLFTHELLV